MSSLKKYFPQISLLKYIVGFINILFILTSCSVVNGGLVVDNGEIDISKLDFDKRTEFAIYGKGLFYWKQWPVNKDGSFNQTLLNKENTVDWPSPLWTRFGYDSKGFGTFRLILKRKKENAPIVINIGRLLGAAEVWINGKKHANYGVISKDGKTEVPYGQPIHLNLPNEEKLDVLFLVSSHNNRLGGGPALQNVIQTKKFNTSNQKVNPLTEGLITFLIIFFGLFQIYRFITFNKELYFLYFGLFCLVGVSRQLFVGETLIYNFFPEISFGVVQRMRYIGYFGGLSLTILYYNSLYPNYIKSSFVIILSCIPVLGIIYVLLVPVYYGTLIAPFFQVYGLCIIVLGLYIVFCAVRDKKPFTTWVLIILLIQIIAFANDILTAMLIIDSRYIINYSILGYIIFHVYLNHKFQVRKEKLLNELSFNVNTLKSDIDDKIEEIESLRKDTFQHIKSKERMVDSLKKVAADDKKVSIQSLIADLKSELLEDAQLIILKNDIEGVNKEFVQRIKKIHPNLTKTDLEICTYLRMSLERKEIARLRATSVDAVKKSRYRLRKKLALDTGTDLVTYLKTI